MRLLLCNNMTHPFTIYFYLIGTMHGYHFRHLLKCSMIHSTFHLVLVSVWFLHLWVLVGISSPGHSQSLSCSCGEKTGFLHSCKIKSGSGLGMMLIISGKNTWHRIWKYSWSSWLYYGQMIKYNLAKFVISGSNPERPLVYVYNKSIASNSWQQVVSETLS